MLKNNISYREILLIKIGEFFSDSKIQFKKIILTLCGTVASPDATYFFTNFRNLNVILIRLSNFFLLFYEPRILSNINSRLKVPDFVKICQF